MISEILCGKWMQRYRRSASSSLSPGTLGSNPSTLPRSPRQIAVVSARNSSTSTGVSASGRIQ